jgi:hypothetical protein
MLGCWIRLRRCVSASLRFCHSCMLASTKAKSIQLGSELLRLLLLATQRRSIGVGRRGNTCPPLVGAAVHPAAGEPAGRRLHRKHRPTRCSAAKSEQLMNNWAWVLGGRWAFAVRWNGHPGRLPPRRSGPKVDPWLGGVRASGAPKGTLEAPPGYLQVHTLPGSREPARPAGQSIVHTGRWACTGSWSRQSSCAAPTSHRYWSFERCCAHQEYVSHAVWEMLVERDTKPPHIGL